MSRKIYKLDSKLSVNFAIHNFVGQKKKKTGLDWQALSDYVRRTAKEKGLSYREVAERGGISHGSVSNIINLRNKRDIGTDTLRAIARGLEVPEEEILSIARGSEPETEEEFLRSSYYQAFLRHKEATGEERKFLEGVMDMINQYKHKKTG
jgi:transcriptional regulator with XRE-family HTH domain